MIVDLSPPAEEQKKTKLQLWFQVFILTDA